MNSDNARSVLNEWRGAVPESAPSQASCHASRRAMRHRTRAMLRPSHLRVVVQRVTCKSLVPWLVGWACFLTPTGSASAHEYPLTVAQVVERSDRIIVGDVRSVDAFWDRDKRIINTQIVVSITDVLLGSESDTLVFTVAGGTVGDLTMTRCTSPHLQGGDHVLLFLRGDPAQLTGCYQGAYLCDATDSVRMNGAFDKRFDQQLIQPLEGLLRAIDLALPGQPAIELKPYKGSFDLTAAYKFIAKPYDWTWNANPMGENYLINPNCSDNSAGSAAEQIAQINAGASAWNDAGANFVFTYGGQTNSTLDGLDGNNIAYFSTDAAIDNSIIAYIQPWSQGSNFVEWDLVFNDVDSSFWNGTTGSCFNMQDIRSVATHELDHGLGLDHSPDPLATMFSSVGTCDLNMQSLAQDDIDGIQSIYGGDIIWVDFSYTLAESGSFNEPFNTLAEAVAVVPLGGHIRIKSGTTSAIITVTKPLQMTSYGGAAIIGQ